MVKQKCLYKVLETLISSISLQQEISAMVKQKCLYKVLLHRNSVPSISLQQEISAIVKQKCLHRFLIHRISNPYSFSATRNMCNGEREMSFCMTPICNVHYTTPC